MAPSVFLPGETHGQRSQVGYSPQGHKELDTTEVTQHACMLPPSCHFWLRTHMKLPRGFPSLSLSLSLSLWPLGFDVLFLRSSSNSKSSLIPQTVGQPHPIKLRLQNPSPRMSFPSTTDLQKKNKSSPPLKGFINFNLFLLPNLMLPTSTIAIQIHGLNLFHLL